MSAQELAPYDFGGGLDADSLRGMFVWAARNNVSDIHLQGDTRPLVMPHKGQVIFPGRRW